MRAPLISHSPIFLRLAHPGQATDLYTVLETERSLLSPIFHRVNQCTSEKEVERILREAQLFHKLGRQYLVFIYYGKSLIGSINVIKREPNSTAGEIGFWLCRSNQGLGLMSTSTRLFIDYVFNQQIVLNLFMRIHPENTPAITLSKALGFSRKPTANQVFRAQHEGKGTVCFGLEKHDWPA